LSLSTGISGSGKVNVSGTVSGATGISVAPGSTASQTVTVSGSVTGTSGTAVSLTQSGSDRLILQPGAAFQGTVNGGGGKSVLEITAAGAGAAASGPSAAGYTYVNLNQITNFSLLQI